MICVECGAESTFWLCSNRCALAYGQKHKRVRCAVCSFNPKTRRFGRHDTNKLCTACRQLPENRDWKRAKKEEPDDLIETRLAERERLLDEQDRPLPKITARTTRIAKMVMDRERVAYAYFDKKGRRRGIRYRWRDYTIRRIAEKEGCSRWEVEEVIRGIES